MWSQSTFSAGIRKLEEQLNCQLFYRDKRNVRLTEAGLNLLPKAKDLLARWHAIETEFNHQEPRNLRLGASQNLAADAIVPELSRFLDLYGHYHVTLREETYAELLILIEKEELDAAFVPEYEIDHDLVDSKFIFEEKLAVAVPSTHPYSSKESLSVIDLHELPMIERKHCSLFDKVAKALKDRDIQPTTVFTAQNNDMATAMVSSGMGFSLMNRPPKPKEGITFLPLSDADFVGRIDLIWKKNRMTRPLANFLGLE